MQHKLLKGAVFIMIDCMINTAPYFLPYQCRTADKVIDKHCNKW